MAEAVLTRENPEVCGQVIKELTAGQGKLVIIIILGQT